MVKLTLAVASFACVMMGCGSGGGNTLPGLSDLGASHGGASGTAGSAGSSDVAGHAGSSAAASAAGVSGSSGASGAAGSSGSAGKGNAGGMSAAGLGGSGGLSGSSGLGGNGSTGGAGSSGVGGSAGGGVGGVSSQGGVSGSSGTGNASGTGGAAGAAGSSGQAGAGNAAGTGGQSGMGQAGMNPAGQGGAVCQPTLEVETFSHLTTGLMPGTTGSTLMTIKFAAGSCADVAVDALQLHLFSPDFTLGDDTPFCAEPCSTPDAWDFQNFRMVDEASGATVAGPISLAHGAGAPAVASFTDAFTISAGQSKTVDIVFDVAATLTANLFGMHFGAVVDSASGSGVPAVGYSDASPDPNATFQIVAPPPVLSTTLDPATPASAIVIGGTSGWSPFGQYTITNLTTVPQVFDSAVLRQADPDGDDADFTSVALAMNGMPVLQASSVDASGNWIATGSQPVTVPASGSITVQTWAMMAKVQSSQAVSGEWHGYPRSGHTPVLALASVAAEQSGWPVPEPADPTLPNRMVLRATAPTVTTHALKATSLVNVDEDFYKIGIGADAAGPVAWKQVAFACTATSVSLSALACRIGSIALDAATYDIVGWPVDASAVAQSPDAVWNPASGGAYTDVKAPGNPLTGSFAFVLSFHDGVEQTVAGGGSIYTFHATMSGASAASVLTCAPIQDAHPGIFITEPLALGTSPTIYGFQPMSSPTWLNAVFVWSDRSEMPHSASDTMSSVDWTNETLIHDLTQTQTL